MTKVRQTHRYNIGNYNNTKTTKEITINYEVRKVDPRHCLIGSGLTP